MSQPTTDIDALHVAMKAALVAEFDGVTVDFYPRPGERIATPAILLELEDMAVEDPDDIGTDQMPITLNFNAYVVVNYKEGKKQAVKAFAGAVMAFARAKRWGQPVGPARVTGAYPDVIAGREDDYEVMRIEFAHDALLGTDIWTDDGETVMPWKVYLGIAPKIGPDHIDDYELIYEGPEPEAPTP
jgi:hypothetical protein